MRKRLFLVGMVLLLLGLTLLILPQTLLIGFLREINLAGVSYSRHDVIEPSIVEVTGTSYNISFPAYRSLVLSGNYTIISGEPVTLVCFDDRGFANWSRSGLGKPLFFTSPSNNGTFSYEVKENGTYHVVLLKPGKENTIMLLSVYLLEKTYVLPEYFTLAAFTLAIIGLGITYYSTRSAFKERKAREGEKVVRAAKALGIAVEGKSLEQLRKEIRERLKK